MGLNDAAEMLEVAKAENQRLLRELIQMKHVAQAVTGFYGAAEREVLQLEGERDRARATAVRLEQELAEATSVLDSYRFPTGQEGVLTLEQARRAMWPCE